MFSRFIFKDHGFSDLWSFLTSFSCFSTCLSAAGPCYLDKQSSRAPSSGRKKTAGESGDKLFLNSRH